MDQGHSLQGVSSSAPPESVTRHSQTSAAQSAGRELSTHDVSRQQVSLLAVSVHHIHSHLSEQHNLRRVLAHWTATPPTNSKCHSRNHKHLSSRKRFLRLRVLHPSPALLFLLRRVVRTRATCNSNTFSSCSKLIFLRRVPQSKATLTSKLPRSLQQTQTVCSDPSS